jgi:hypothetical protein
VRDWKEILIRAVRSLRSQEMEIAFLSNAAFSWDLLAEEAAKGLMGSFVGYWFGKY